MRVMPCARNRFALGRTDDASASLLAPHWGLRSGAGRAPPHLLAAPTALLVFSMQLGVCNPAVLRTLPTEEVRMGILPSSLEVLLLLSSQKLANAHPTLHVSWQLDAGEPPGAQRPSSDPGGGPTAAHCLLQQGAVSTGPLCR